MLCGRCPRRTCRRRNVVGKGRGCFWLLRSFCLFLLGQYDGRPSAKVTEVGNIEFCTASSAYSAFGWRAEYYKKPPKAIAKRRVSNPFLSPLKLFVHQITQPNTDWKKIVFDAKNMLCAYYYILSACVYRRFVEVTSRLSTSCSRLSWFGCIPPSHQSTISDIKISVFDWTLWRLQNVFVIICCCTLLWRSLGMFKAWS